MFLGSLGRVCRRSAVFAAGVGLAAVSLAEARFETPGRGQAVSAGSTLEVRWTVELDRPSEASEAEVVLSLDGGVTFPIRLTPEISAEAGAFRWRVPALSTSHARLALRTGGGEASETERLDLVSDEFTILADSDGQPEELFQGSREWWTLQALSGVGAEDMPAGTMAGGREHLISPDSCPDMSEPSAPCLSVPRAASARPADGSRSTPAASDRLAPRQTFDTLPLRL